MQPRYSTPVPFAVDATCFLVPGALDDAECGRIVGDIGSSFAPTGLEYPASYRDNARAVRDDPELAAALFERLRSVLPARLRGDDGATYVLVGLNERFRFCRYEDGQCFRVHRDGAHARNERERSRLTLQIYLDEGFSGGHTRFFASRFGACVGAVEPVRGSAIVFDHALWHDGEPVTHGRKHVLRTDVMYAREQPRAQASDGTLRGHAGYVYRVITLADGRLASASRDRTIRVWGAPTSEDCPTVLGGHRASVHALVEAEPGVLWSGGRDHTLRVTRLDDGTSHEVADLGCAALCLEREHDGRIACGSADGIVRRFDPDDGAAFTEHRGHEGWIWALAALGELLVSGSEDGTVRLWNGNGCLDTARPGRGAIHALARIDDATFAAGCADGHVVFYAIDRGTLSPIDVLHAHEGEVYALCAVADGVLASGGEDARVRVHRLRDRALLATVEHEDFVRSLAMASDGILVSASYDGTLRRTELGARDRSPTAADIRSGTIARWPKACSPVA